MYCSSVLKLRTIKYTKGKRRVAESGSAMTTMPMTASALETPDTGVGGNIIRKVCVCDRKRTERWWGCYS